MGILDKRIRRERREWMETVKSEERRMEAKKRKEMLYRSYEREVVVPKEIRHEIDEGKLAPEEALQQAIYAYGDEEKEDEFSNVTEPRPIITTSRSPSDALVRFAKALKHIFPNAEKINRGKHVINNLVELAVSKGHTDIIMVHEHKGVPSSITVSHLPHGPTAYFSLHHVDTDGETCRSTAPPAILFDNFTTKLGIRLKRALSSLFPPLAPREKPKRIVTFANRDDSIVFRQFRSSIQQGNAELEPLGPSFTMRLYELRAGTLDMTYAEKEFVFRPYMNTAHKKTYLGEEKE